MMDDDSVTAPAFSSAGGRACRGGSLRGSHQNAASYSPTESRSRMTHRRHLSTWRRPSHTLAPVRLHHLVERSHATSERLSEPERTPILAVLTTRSAGAPHALSG